MSLSSTDKSTDKDDTPYFDGNMLKKRGWLRRLKPWLYTTYPAIQTLTERGYYVEKGRTITDTVKRAKQIANGTLPPYSFEHPAFCGKPVPGHIDHSLSPEALAAALTPFGTPTATPPVAGTPAGDAALNAANAAAALAALAPPALITGIRPLELTDDEKARFDVRPELCDDKLTTFANTITSLVTNRTLAKAMLLKCKNNAGLLLYQLEQECLAMS